MLAPKFFLFSLLCSFLLSAGIRGQAEPLPATKTEASMVKWVNEERSKRKLASLSVDIALQKSARAHSLEMQKLGYFSHASPVPENQEPIDRMRRAGVTYENVAENISLYETDAPKMAVAQIVKESMQGLMNSPKHRKNILAPDFNRLGVGMVLEKKGMKRSLWITQHFAAAKILLDEPTWETRQGHPVVKGKGESLTSLPVILWQDNDSKNFSCLTEKGGNFEYAFPWPADRATHLIHFGVIIKEQGMTLELEPTNRLQLAPPLP